MTVQELIDELQKVEDKSIPIVVYGEHGECCDVIASSAKVESDFYPNGYSSNLPCVRIE